MSEHKLKSPGQIKGAGYKAKQVKTIRARWAVQAKLGERWPEKHIKGYRKLKADQDRESGLDKKEI